MHQVNNRHNIVAKALGNLNKQATLMGKYLRAVRKQEEKNKFRFKMFRRKEGS